MPAAALPTLRRTLTVLPILLALALCRSGVGAPQQVPSSLQSAVAAFDAKDYARAATLARVAGDRESGVARESARYLEGLAQYRAGDLEAAATALRFAAASTDRFVASQAGVTLGSVELERKRFDAAAHAYRRAAGFMDAPEAKRARSIAARCFDAAGQSVLAEAERAAAGEPRRVAAPSPDTAAAPPAAPAAPQPPVRFDQPKRTVTADEKPKPASTASIAPVRFAIQAGAFRSAASASDLASKLEASCADLSLAPPRVIATDDSKGTLYLVQFGDFPNRGAATRMLLKFPRTAYRVERRIDDGLTQADSP